MNIRKSDGTLQAFNGQKIERALERAQVDHAITKRILEELPRFVRPGTSTQEIHQRVLHMLEQEDPVGAARYHLKHAMFDLGPSGYPFEEYVSQLLQAYGWKTQVSKEVWGQCVDHEIDVYAEREDEIRAIEAKYRNRPGGRVDIKVALYVHARHLDLAAKDANVQGALFTNTSFTRSARQYGECVGMKMKGWNYPQDNGIAKYIEQKQLYPVTVFSSLPGRSVKRFTKDGIVMAHQLCELPATSASDYQLSEHTFTQLQEHARNLCQKHS